MLFSSQFLNVRGPEYAISWVFVCFKICVLKCNYMAIIYKLGTWQSVIGPRTQEVLGFLGKEFNSRCRRDTKLRFALQLEQSKYTLVIYKWKKLEPWVISGLLFLYKAFVYIYKVGWHVHKFVTLFSYDKSWKNRSPFEGFFFLSSTYLKAY